jgi:hypothetical protein
VWSQTKGTGCTERKDVAYDRLPYPRVGGFEWDTATPIWKDRLSELANYRKIHGHCNVPHNDKELSKLATWVITQRDTYRLHRRKSVAYDRLPYQELTSLVFEWLCIRILTWEDRLSELEPS